MQHPTKLNFIDDVAHPWGVLHTLYKFTYKILRLLYSLRRKVPTKEKRHINQGYHRRHFDQGPYDRRERSTTIDTKYCNGYGDS